MEFQRGTRHHRDEKQIEIKLRFIYKKPLNRGFFINKNLIFKHSK